MDTFGSSPNQTRAIVRDTLTTSSSTNNKGPSTLRAAIPAAKDSVTISTKDINQIIETIRANNITDINEIKDSLSLKDTRSNFALTSLSDHQLARVLSAVRANIAENLAEVIYNTKNNEKLLDITAKEKAHIDSILTKVRNSQITNLRQAIDFVQSHSSDNPSIMSKISGSLLNIVHQNEQQNVFNTLRQDNFTPAFSFEPAKFSNPFKSTADTRNIQPRTRAEAQQFLREAIATNQDIRRQMAIQQNTVDMSNLILANYLSGKNPELIAEEMTKGGIKGMTIEDQVWYQEKIAHKNINFLNNVAAKVAANKAKIIITCRLAGQVGGAAAGALGMASIAGATPLIGIVGAFMLTLVASIAGFTLGRAIGEGLGKTITKTDFGSRTPEEYEEYVRQIKLLEQEKEEQERKSKQQYVETEESEEETDTEITSSTTKTSLFDDIDSKVSAALKSKILYKRD